MHYRKNPFYKNNRKIILKLHNMFDKLKFNSGNNAIMQ